MERELLLGKMLVKRSISLLLHLSVSEITISQLKLCRKKPVTHVACVDFLVMKLRIVGSILNPNLSDLHLLLIY